MSGFESGWSPHPDAINPFAERPFVGDATKDGRAWQIGTASDVAWIANGTTPRGSAITVAIPPVFEAYATFYEPDGVTVPTHEQAVVKQLV